MHDLLAHSRPQGAESSRRQGYPQGSGYGPPLQLGIQPSSTPRFKIGTFFPFLSSMQNLNPPSTPQVDPPRTKGRVLLLDTDPVAILAMRGILTRGGHTCVAVESTTAAWRELRGSQTINLIIVELALKDECGASFIQNLKGNCYLKHIPLIVYTSVVQRAQVQKILGLRIQNFLRKPYVDDIIFKETLKACELAWKELLFTKADDTSGIPGQSSVELKAARSALAVALETNLALIRTTDPVPAQLRKIIIDLTAEAEIAGATAIQSNLRDLLISSEHSTASFIENLRTDLAYAAMILREYLNPGHGTDSVPIVDPEAVRENLEYSKWSEADISKGPLVSAEVVAEKLAALKGCPVIDTIAASFEMTAKKSSANLTQLIEMVSNDAGLAATALGAAGKLGHHTEVIEDPALAVSLLGALRLVAIAKDNPKIEERFLNVAPMNWENFWTFQVGVSRFAAFACEQLEFKELAPIARVAGLLHNIGRLITIKLFPHAIPTLMKYAVDQKVAFADAERAYLGVTSRELGLRFAEAWELPNRICNVLGWLDTPDRAPEDESLVSIVALSKHFCIQNKVGCSGDPVSASTTPLAESGAWSVLQSRVFPSFELKKFESQAHTFCRELRYSLAGQNAE